MGHWFLGWIYQFWHATVLDTFWHFDMLPCCEKGVCYDFRLWGLPPSLELCGACSFFLTSWASRSFNPSIFSAPGLIGCIPPLRILGLGSSTDTDFIFIDLLYRCIARLRRQCKSWKHHLPPEGTSFQGLSISSIIRFSFVQGCRLSSTILQALYI